ncbi:putative transporter svop-1 [Bolinopsis microptera]|uniref:putative transporter svop-1 n=1 Tax=Bolinopsis microptera TaxID=2820187 RepID=UPI00307A3826
MEETLLDKKHGEYGSTTTEKAPEDDDEKELDLDEVYKIIGRGPAQYLYWLLTGLLSVSDLSEICIIAVIIPLQRCEWKLSPAFEGAVSMSVFIFYAIFAIVFGKISDKFGRKLVLKWSMIIMTIATITSALSPNKWVFIVVRSVTGACIGTNINCIICYATEFSESKDRLIGMTMFNIVAASSYALLYFIAWLMLNSIGWRWFIIVMSLPLIPALALTFLLPGSPRYFLVSGQDDKVVQSVRFMAKLNKKHLPSDLKLSCSRKEDLGSYSVIFGPQHKRSTVTLSVLYFCSVFLTFAFILYQPLIIKNGCSSAPRNQSTRTCSILTQEELIKLAISTAPFAVGNILATVSAAFLGRRLSLRISSFIFIFVIAALFLCMNSTVTVFLVSAANFFGGFINALLWIIFPETFPTNIRTTATGFINSAGKIGGVLGTGSVSVFYYMDPNIVTGLLFTASVLGFIMTLIYNRETKDVVMKDT